ACRGATKNSATPRASPHPRMPARRNDRRAYTQRLGDAPAVREALAVIVEAARTGADAAQLPPEVRQAYLKLDEALALGCAWHGRRCRLRPLAVQPRCVVRRGQSTQRRVRRAFARRHSRNRCASFPSGP
ncbi:hypothetical protein ACTMU2_41795, partial [Cupriavidus basilensis]